VSACGRNRRRRKAHQPAPSGRGPCTRRPCRCCPWSGRRRVPERCLRVEPSSSAPQRHTRETTISFSFTMFLCASDVRILISRMAVIGKPSFSLSCQRGRGERDTRPLASRPCHADFLQRHHLTGGPVAALVHLRLGERGTATPPRQRACPYVPSPICTNESRSYSSTERALPHDGCTRCEEAIAQADGGRRKAAARHGLLPERGGWRQGKTQAHTNKTSNAHLSVR